MRLGVLGLGFMGATHIRALDGIEGVTLAAISSSDPKKLAGDLSSVGGNLGEGFATLDFSQVDKHPRWETILEDPTIDAVDICLPTHLHAPATEAALRAGKHVLVEKPMALDFETAIQLVALAKQQGKILMAAQVLRFFTMYRQMADLVRSGTLGQVRAAAFRRRCSAPPWAAWMQDKSVSGGGVFDLLLIGFTLLIEGFDVHVPKGYIYFAMAFAFLVDVIQMKVAGKKSHPVKLNEHFTEDAKK